MIADQLSHAATYLQLNPRFAQAFKWLEQFTLEIPVGRYPLGGEELFALVQSYDTVLPAAKKFESHRRYLDIQYVAAGAETMLYIPISDLQPTMEYDEQKDILLYAEPDRASAFTLLPGCFAIFYPQDGHKPGVIWQSPTQVRKVVLKVAV